MDAARKEQARVQMRRVQKILENPDFQCALKRNEEAERNRKFCRHGMPHFLDTARLAYLFALERDIPLAKDLLYAAALLHDIGRWKQEQDGTPHEEASAQLAIPILEAAGYSGPECQQITTAILGHRSAGGTKDALSELLYDADKASRCCFLCPAQAECNWSEERKNMQLLW